MMQLSSLDLRYGAFLATDLVVCEIDQRVHGPRIWDQQVNFGHWLIDQGEIREYPFSLLYWRNIYHQLVDINLAFLVSPSTQ